MITLGIKIFFISADFRNEEDSILDENFETIKTKLPQNLNLFDIFKIDLNNKTTYVVVHKKHYFESETLESLFYLLDKLKITLVENHETSIALSKFSQNFNYLKWNIIKSVLKFVFLSTSINIFVYLNNVITPDKDQIPIILDEFHTKVSSGHQGIARTFQRIRQFYYWKGMRNDISDFVKKCSICQKNKKLPPKIKAPMELTTTASRPLEKLSIDIVGPYPLSDSENRFVITAQDDLTRFAFAIPVPNHEASTVANSLSEHVFSKFGIPETILTDRGTEFVSKLMKRFTTLYDIKHNLCAAYHPQSNGALERSHSLLHSYLRHYISENQTNWDRFVHFAMFAFNTSINRNTGFSLFELLFGHRPNIPSKFYNRPSSIYGYEDYIAEIRTRLHENFKRAKDNLMKSKLKEKEHYDNTSRPIDIEIGDKVWLLNERPQLSRAKKLLPVFTGPYTVLRKQGLVDFIIEVKRKEMLVHANRLKRDRS